MTIEESNFYKTIQDRIRYFNKHILNPFTLSFSGRPHSIYTVVRHVGRRSGQLYDTPVLGEKVGDTFILPLPYSEQVDWCRNVIAAGECTLIHQGKAYRAGEAQIIGLDEGIQAYPELVQVLLRRNAERTGHDQFLRLKQLSQENETAYQQFTRQHPTERAVWMLATVAAVILALRKSAGWVSGRGAKGSA